MKLTDARCRNAKPGPKLRKLSDGGGLYLCLMPSGSKLWWVAYRFADKQKTLSLGAYPTVTLADARLLRDQAKSQQKSGLDPSTEKKAAKARRSNPSTTFRALLSIAVTPVESLRSILACG